MLRVACRSAQRSSGCRPRWGTIRRESRLSFRASAAFDGTALLDVLDADGDIPAIRLHHEIYLGDPRKTKPENLKTVIRHPVRAREA